MTQQQKIDEIKRNIDYVLTNIYNYEETLHDHPDWDLNLVASLDHLDDNLKAMSKCVAELRKFK